MVEGVLKVYVKLLYLLLGIKCNFVDSRPTFIADFPILVLALHPGWIFLEEILCEIKYGSECFLQQLLMLQKWIFATFLLQKIVARNFGDFWHVANWNVANFSRIKNCCKYQCCKLFGQICIVAKANCCKKKNLCPHPPIDIISNIRKIPGGRRISRELNYAENLTNIFWC